jgi:acyl-CoA thioesterase-1
VTYPFILAFGDSLTAGYGLAPAEAFPRQLELLLRQRHGDASVHNAGVSGDTSAGGRARLSRVLAGLRAKPDLAIVELGANDLIRGIAPERMRDNLEAILTELGRCGIPVLLAGMWAPPFLGAFAERFNRVFPDLAKAQGVPLYPFFLAGVAGDRALTLRDRIHPNARAIEIVAARILPHVEGALAAHRKHAA